jgi:DNA-binding SARP family transcriptional activator
MPYLLTIKLFGELSVTDSTGSEVPLPNRKAQALVAYLALRLHARRPPSEIAALLFDGMDSESALSSLYSVASEIRHSRRFPQDALEEEDGMIYLREDVVLVDAEEFERQVSVGSLIALREAEELYTGNLFEGFRSGSEAFDRWLQEERVRFWTGARSALARLLALQVEAGWREAAIENASRLLAIDPSQEVVHRTLIRLQLEQGRPDAAMRRYQECVDIFRRSGRDPAPETQKLHDQIKKALSKAPPRRDFNRPSAHPMLVLLLEDDLVSATLFEGYLTDAGYDVVTVNDGADALMEIGRRKFDLLVCDINVPTLDGLKLFEIMIQKGIETPAVFVTGISGAAVEVRSMEMGAADFLRKPVRKEVLLSRIRSVLEQRDRASGRS